MPFVYLDRELDGNNHITGSYRISIDTKRKLSWSGNPNKLEPYHYIEVLNGQDVKTTLLKEFEKYKNENQNRDWLYLPLLELDEVLMMMNEYREEKIDNAYKSSSSSSDSDMGGCFLFGILFVIIFALISISNPPNSIIPEEYEDNTSAKYTAIVDSRVLNNSYNAVNVRSSHTTKSKVIKTLKNGTRIFFSKTANGWVHVILDDGRKGWIASNVIKGKMKNPGR